MKDCRLVVLNYNGEALLRNCLPSILEAATQSRRRCPVTVLDNQSVDESRRLVQTQFPEVDFVKSGGNKVLCSYNDYLTGIQEEFVILLNNDIFVDANFIDPLLDRLEGDPDIFFAASKTFGADRKTYLGSLSKIGFSWGLIWGTSLFEGHLEKASSPARTMLCGSGAFRKSYFSALGGYDELYLPGTVEDLDLCYRAYRRGWSGVYCPESVMHHIGQVSFKKHFGEAGLRRINRRNLYFFVWKNIRSPRLLAEHLFCVPLQLAKYVCEGQWDFLRGFFEAVWRLPEALRRRRIEAERISTRTDEEIFELSSAI